MPRHTHRQRRAKELISQYMSYKHLKRELRKHHHSHKPSAEEEFEEITPEIILEQASGEIRESLASLPFDELPLDFILHDWTDWKSTTPSDTSNISLSTLSSISSLGNSDSMDTDGGSLDDDDDGGDIGLDIELDEIEKFFDEQPEMEPRDSETDVWIDEETLGTTSLSHHSFSRHIATSLIQLFSSRYLKSRKNAIRVASQMPDFLGKIKLHQPDVFRQDLRVSPNTFDALVQRLETDPVFSNSSSQDQMPVEHQVAIMLYRFGHSGNGVGLNKVARWSGYSKGTIVLATRRVLTAILRPSFLQDMISLPTQEEKEEAKEWVGMRAKCDAWRDGWCMVDGTLIPLHARPYWYGESYFDRKNDYSLNIQIINTPDLYIIDCGYGFTGSTHDATAWERTWIYAHHDEVFEDDEFIWADSAYPIQTWLVAPYKQPDSNIPQNEIFNTVLSSVRIKSENCIGFLKGRFQSLKGLRINIVNEKTHKYATYWILGSVAVHDFALRCEKQEKDQGLYHANRTEGMADPFVEFGPSHRDRDREREGRVSTEAGAASGARSVNLAAAKARREELKQCLFAANSSLTLSDLTYDN
ncbi:hypothetical protein CVT24_004353 [Panaeolus cyanescens]|uniref:DDE Tnp4 domain-containing protein n=1 Tax=Panaeolus cyanescens TaxID=181874 RepID=A0A409W7P4_9AGAR|nr:hypothetical protein CVT24_004353 [Panaeolus cyanescens]